MPDLPLESLLIEAAASGSSEKINELPDAIVNHIYKNQGNKTALIIATQYNQPQAVEALINKGADINMVTTMGDSALLLALKKGHVEMAKFLLEQDDIYVSTTNNEGVAAIHRACLLDNHDLVVTLIDKGAEVNIAADNGSYPLDLTQDKSIKNLLNNIINFTELPQYVVEEAKATKLPAQSIGSR